MAPFRAVALAALAFAVSVPPSPAQSAISAKAGLVDYTQGKVYIDDRPIEATATQFPSLRENSVMRVETGRAEIMLGACTALWVGYYSSFRMLSGTPPDTRIELLTGAAVAAVGEATKNSKLMVVVKSAEVAPDHKGTYRFDIDPPSVKVAAGRAVVAWMGRTFSVGSGQMLPFDGAPAIRKIEKRGPDPLDEWSRSRAAILARGGVYRRQTVLSVNAAADAAAQAATAPVANHDPDQPYYDSNATHGGPPPPSPIPDLARSGASRSGICGW